MSLFLADTISSTTSTVLSNLARVCLVLIALLCLVLVVLVFMQITGESEANNVITGNQDSYYAHNKSGSRQGRITRLIYICLGIVAVLAIAYFILIKVVY